MEHWLIAIVAPLTELNPAKYVLEPDYRASSARRLGRRANRIFIYQVLIGILLLALVSVLIWGGWRPSDAVAA